MKKLLTLLLAATLATSAVAKPGYAPARKLYDEMERFKYKTDLWHQQSPTERIAQAKKAANLVAQAEKMWPSGASCRNAGRRLQVYVSDLNNWAQFYDGIGSQPSHLKINMLASVGYEFGEAMANCYNDVEALDPRNK